MSRFVHDLRGGPASAAVLGELGAGLVGMQRLELPVPRGFVLSSQAHRAAIEAGGRMPAEVWEEVAMALLDLRDGAAVTRAVDAREQDGGHAQPATPQRGDGESGSGAPDVAVRPSPPPHMGDVLPSFGRAQAGGPAPGQPAAGAHNDVDRVRQAILSIWSAWESPQAAAQRDLRGISSQDGTAIVVLAEVGGQGELGRGTIFTRDPESGSPEPVGRLGSETPEQHADGGVAELATVRLSALRQQLSRELYRQLAGAIPLLEADWRDLCEISFVVDADQLWFVGIRQAERSSRAAVRVAVDMANEGMIAREQALSRVPLSALLELQAPIAIQLRDSAASGEARLVPAQPDIHTTQLLDWCDERRWLQVAQSVPSGWTPIARAAEIASASASRLLLDIASLRAEFAPLRESLAAATRTQASELGVQLGDLPRGGDLTLPPGAWTLVVGDAARSWAARLLGARPTRPASSSGVPMQALDRS
jgi:hypothetical protein